MDELVKVVAKATRRQVLRLPLMQSVAKAALDYVQQTHPGTSPLPEQLAVLRSLPFLTAAASPQLPAVA